jgi:hypothetical protein
MADLTIVSINGGPVPAFETWVASLPEGSEKANIQRVCALQEQHWLSGNEETPHPEFAEVWAKYMEANNLTMA